SMTSDGSLTTLTFTAGDLSPNTTYFIRVGSLWNGTTSFALTQPPSTSTLTTALTPQLYQVLVTTVVLNWPSLAGQGGSEGYELDAATDAGFSNVIKSSITADVNQSTLSITGLAAYTTYYFRVGGINWDNAVNYTSLGATRTAIGAAPVPAITAV